MPDNYKSHPLCGKDETRFYNETSVYLQHVEHELDNIQEESTEAWNGIKAAADTVSGVSDLIVARPIEPAP